MALASLRGDIWKQQAHLLITRRTAQVTYRSHLTVWLAGDTPPARTETAIYDVRVFTRAQSEGACVRGCEVLGRTAPATAFGVGVCRRRDLTVFVTYCQILPYWGYGYSVTVPGRAYRLTDTLNTDCE